MSDFIVTGEISKYLKITDILSFVTNKWDSTAKIIEKRIRFVYDEREYEIFDAVRQTTRRFVGDICPEKFAETIFKLRAANGTCAINPDSSEEVHIAGEIVRNFGGGEVHFCCECIEL